MSKEHSGGINHAGLFRVPGEWSDDQRFAVKIDFFDFDRLDSLDDLVKEELRLKGTVKNLFKKLVSFELQKAKTETAVAVLAHIIDAEDSGLAAIQISFACGMMFTAGKSGDEYAGQFGISKQAFQQGVDRYSDKLGLRKTRCMRDDSARDLMRLSNFRPGAK